MTATIAVVAKAPRAGAVKTRLCPPCTHEEAARLAQAALADTLAAVAVTRATRRVVSLDGAAELRLPADLEVVRQRGADLAERLASLFDDLGGPALVVAMDTPQVTPALLEPGLCALETGTADAVLGPAADGGYWAIGLRRADRRVFDAIPMSAPHTGATQLARLRELGLEVHALPVLRDVDDFEDAVAVAAEMPGSEFGRAVAAVAARVT